MYHFRSFDSFFQAVYQYLLACMSRDGILHERN